MTTENPDSTEKDRKSVFSGEYPFGLIPEIPIFIAKISIEHLVQATGHAM